jgi:hypothetical protein
MLKAGRVEPLLLSIAELQRKHCEQRKGTVCSEQPR